MKRRLRMFLVCSAIGGLLASCAGTSDGGQAAGTASAASTTAPTTTAAPTTVPATATTGAPTTTVAPTTTTTMAPTTTTTVAPSVMAPDAGLLTQLTGVPGYEFTAAGADAIGPFGWLDARWMSDEQMFDRYTVATVTKAGVPVARAIVMAASAARLGYATPVLDEYAFLDDVEAVGEAELGGSTTHDWLTIEIAVTGTTDAMVWRTWYHEGFAYLVWSDQPAELEAVTTGLASAQHVHPAYTTVAQMEGEQNLAARFVPLGDATYETTGKYVSTRELLSMGNSFRATMPYAQHVAYRAIVMPGQGLVAVLAVVQMHQEFTDHVDEAEYLLTAGPDMVTFTAGSVTYGVGSDGAVRWLLDGCLYILMPTSSDSPGAEVLTAWVMTIISTPIPES